MTMALKAAFVPSLWVKVPLTLPVAAVRVTLKLASLLSNLATAFALLMFNGLLMRSMSPPSTNDSVAFGVGAVSRSRSTESPDGTAYFAPTS